MARLSCRAIGGMMGGLNIASHEAADWSERQGSSGRFSDRIALITQNSLPDGRVIAVHTAPQTGGVGETGYILGRCSTGW